MRHLALLLFCLGTAPGLWAQELVNFRVTAKPWPARYFVDGVSYSGDVQFVWPQGSKHLIRIFPTIQYEPNTLNEMVFKGFSDPGGLLQGTDSENELTVVATKSLPQIDLLFVRTIYVDLQLSDCTLDREELCPSPGSVYINGSGPYRRSRRITGLAPNSKLKLQATPDPGWVFMGWNTQLGQNLGFVTEVQLGEGPLILTPRFYQSRRVTFQTEPTGMMLFVDRSPITGPRTMDFAPNSSHLLNAPTPQREPTYGKLMVFDSFSNGQELNTNYNVDSNVPSYETIVARFVPGVVVSFVTNPPGLKLKVDGRDNWANYNFAYALGKTVEFSAPLEQVDGKGNRWLFSRWSNGGAAAQKITVTDEFLTNAGLTAFYEPMGKLTVNTNPPGIPVMVDGTECRTPCLIDKPNGTQVKLSARPQLQLDDNTRLDLMGWSGGGVSDRIVTVTGAAQLLTATYQSSYRLRASVDPAEAGQIRIEPASADGFYPNDTQVALMVTPRAGFKFRRWLGDLDSTSPGQVISVSSPFTLRAMLERVPYLPPSSVRNGAAELSEPGVAAGSIITISGANLTNGTEVGRPSPLAQTLANTTVRLGDRLLPLFYVSPVQINALLPSDVAPGDQTLVINSASNLADVSTSFLVVRNAPGLFFTRMDEQDVLLANHEDGTPVTIASPAKRNETITFFGTGFGPYKRPVPDGFAVPAAPVYEVADPVQGFVNDSTVDGITAVAAPGQVGVVSLKLKVTDALPRATAVQFRLKQGERITNTVLLPLE